MAQHPSTLHVIGIDAGGTKTVCLLADGEGQVISETCGGGANLRAVPWLCEELRRRLPEMARCAAVQTPDRERAHGAVLFAIADARGEARVPTYVP